MKQPFATRNPDLFWTLPKKGGRIRPPLGTTAYAAALTSKRIVRLNRLRNHLACDQGLLGVESSHVPG